jgi:succinyl-diaminopimelate desuccinylase
VEYHELIDERQDEIVEFLRELIRIPSVLGDAKDGAPFGKAVAEVYDFMLGRARADGFDVFDADGWGGHVAWRADTESETPGAVNPTAAAPSGGNPVDGNAPDRIESGQSQPAGISADADSPDALRTLGIPVHLDVVPVGDAWVHEPFGADIADGRIYGRGTSDDKGATAAVYMAMKALRDSGFIPAKTIRLIIGLDEETGWTGMDNYLEAAGPPDFGFTPDGDFPVVNGEMGVLNFELAKKLEKTNDSGVSVRSIEGGNAPNMVPDRARAIITDDAGKGYDHIKEKLAAYRTETGYRLTGKGIGKSFEIVAYGTSAHGSTPDKGLNAISIMMAFFGSLELANESIREFIDFYNKRIGFDFHGAALGAGLEDAPSGKLILNIGQVQVDKDAAILTVNVRYPVTMTSDDFYDALMPTVHQYDLGVVKGFDKAPIWFEPDDPFVVTLMDVYKEQTGDETAQPIVMGGATYARSIPRAVAYGPKFPDGPHVMHQADEYISISDLMQITHIYAEAIRRLTS